MNVEAYMERWLKLDKDDCENDLLCSSDGVCCCLPKCTSACDDDIVVLEFILLCHFHTFNFLNFQQGCDLVVQIKWMIRKEEIRHESWGLHINTGSCKFNVVLYVGMNKIKIYSIFRKFNVPYCS